MVRTSNTHYGLLYLFTLVKINLRHVKLACYNQLVIVFTGLPKFNLS